ncbi:uncharacterized protein LY89DRAFT_690423 [Mollisia scopiformis]|uniref:DUF7918 domain-containing protein n=1 Tax=Mollisia scopiformis TaxID=149040 RepID=A0A132BAI4_MOLSC|nr:uncharacterized protein LY89DRAFT_690423 [Mollisia scopiformis]KUJ09408.1 hypothetical protein LY89DRAFT_690423 [Mollisia scopiformis]
MAIHPLLPGIEVAICVNNEPLREYDDEDSWTGTTRNAVGFETKTITKYIESVADQEFGIKFVLDNHYQLTSPFLVFYTNIDGENFGGAAFDDRKTHTPWVIHQEGVKKGGKGKTPVYLLPFKFTKIETTLNQNAMRTLEDDKKTMSKTGKISIEVFRCSGGASFDRDSNVPKLGLDPDSKLHEKSLKGEPKYHGASFGDARVVSSENKARTYTELDGSDSPILRFVFKYRSNKALKELLIIERLPEPEEAAAPAEAPPEVPPAVDLEHLNDNQRRKVEDFVRNLTEGGPSTQPKKVKRERDGEKSPLQLKKKLKTAEEVEIVDLTGD